MTSLRDNSAPDRFGKMRTQTVRNLVVAQRNANQRRDNLGPAVFLGTTADGLATYRIS